MLVGGRIKYYLKRGQQNEQQLDRERQIVSDMNVDS